MSTRAFFEASAFITFVSSVRARAHVGLAHAHLHEARGGGRQGLLEEVQRVVVVEDLDGVGQGDELLRAGLLDLLELAGLGLAGLVEAGEEVLVREEGLLGVREAVLHLGDGDTELRDLGQLRLDGGRAGGDLLALGGHELAERRDGGVLGGGRVAKVLAELVVERLQDAADLAALGGAVRGLGVRQEGHHLLAVLLAHAHALALEQPLQDARRGALQEAAGRALVHGGDGLAERCDVRLVLSLLGGEGGSLLLADRGGLRLRLLRGGAVVLGLLQVGLAHELVVDLLVLLGLGLDLLLQALEHARDLADRVGLHLGRLAAREGGQGQGQHQELDHLQ